MKKIILTLIIPFIAACSYTSPNTIPSTGNGDRQDTITFKDSNQNLTDAQILEYYKAGFNEEKVMFKNFTIGYHNGTPVKASFPCGDICPGYTTKLITYDVDTAQCSTVNGIVKSVYVPVSIAMMKKEYCFPKIIIDNFPDKFVKE